jgi:calcineurin-like phosphoesterase
MKVLMIGDVVAKPGRIAVLERIQDLREQHEIDFAVMNARTLAGGFSVTPSLCEQLFASGIDVMTSGNHIFDKKKRSTTSANNRACFVPQTIRRPLRQRLLGRRSKRRARRSHERHGPRLHAAKRRSIPSYQ